nr:pyridoxamine 5'-phosphate oxidase family protein [Halopelagius inordinatus]
MRDESTPRSSTRDRPETEAGYGIPTTGEGLLPRSSVERRLTDDRTFWVVTTRPDGAPRARPVWGVFVDGTFHCGGGERTRWVRNLGDDPRVTVHGESGEDAADRLDRVDDA